MTESTEAPSSRTHGRRARRLSPEEAAELETRAAPEPAEQTGPIPPLRGPVAPPTADAPTPKLRKFGRRARVVELDEIPVEGTEVPVTGENEAIRDEDLARLDAERTDEATASEDDDATDGSSEERDSPEPESPDAGGEQPGDEGTLTASTDPAQDTDVQDQPDTDRIQDDGSAPAEPEDQSPAIDDEAPPRTSPVDDEPATDNLTVITDADLAGAVAHRRDGGTATATAVRAPARDADGVELGEMSVSEAPHPRPAPRFDGKVLHRPERSGSHRLLWIVWAVIALAVIALVVLLLTGIIGGSANAMPVAPEGLTALWGTGIENTPWRGTTA